MHIEYGTQTHHTHQKHTISTLTLMSMGLEGTPMFVLNTPSLLSTAHSSCVAEVEAAEQWKPAAHRPLQLLSPRFVTAPVGW